MFPPPGPRVPEGLMRPGDGRAGAAPKNVNVYHLTVYGGNRYLCEDLGGDHYI